MGNSDSKIQRRSSTSTGQATQSHRAKIHSFLEREFNKRADPLSGHLSRSGFQLCLKTMEEEFEMYHLANSPLGIGLFEITIKEKPNGNSVMTSNEFASAMAVLFNHIEPAAMAALTTQAILKWYSHTHPSVNPPAGVLNDEILVSFFEASWRAAWAELSERLLSNVQLNGNAETEAIQRFNDTHVKFFTSHSKELATIVSLAADKTIVVSVGSEAVCIPTSFSFTSKKRAVTGGDTPPLTRRQQHAYPEF